MWEKLFELALFVRSGGKHRKPSEILKTFIKAKDEKESKLTAQETSTLRGAFSFLSDAYKNSDLGKTRMATDQTHFYTLCTSLLSGRLRGISDDGTIVARLTKFAAYIEERDAIPRDAELGKTVSRYLVLSKEKTTDASRRSDRQDALLRAIELIAVGN